MTIGERKKYCSVTGIFVTVIFALYIGISYGFGFDLFSLILPDMKADLGFNYTDAGALSASTRVGFLAGGFIASFSVGLIGHGRMIVLSVMISSICILLMAFVQSIIIVSILLLVIGVCAATVYIPMVVVVAQFIERRHCGKAFGIISSGQACMVFLNGMIAPFFLLNLDWRDLWLFVGTLSIVICAIFFVYLYRLGITQKSASCKPILLGEKMVAESEKLNEDNIVVQSPRKITMQICLIWSLIFFSGFVTQPYQTYISPYLRDELYLSIELTGVVWSALGFAGIFSGVILGAIADKTSTRKALTLCYLLLMSGCILLVLNLNQFTFILAGIVYGLSYYPIYGLIPAYITKNFSTDHAVFVFGISNVFVGLGGALGNFLGGAAKTEFDTFSYNYLVGAVICVLLILIVSRMRLETQRLTPSTTSQAAI